MRPRLIRIALVVCGLLLSEPYATAADMADSKKETMSLQEYLDLQKQLWRGRSKYLYLSYGFQRLNGNSEHVQADYGVALIHGRTYYLHKSPIARRFMIGIDWNRVDLNFAKYPDLPVSDTTPELTDLGIMQAEAGMGMGPSLTAGLVSHLKACLYCHVTPSASMVRQDGDCTFRYATFMNVGLTLSYKVISVGVEQRWNLLKTDYGDIRLSRIDDAGDVAALSANGKLRTNNLRLFVGFRW